MEALSIGLALAVLYGFYLGIKSLRILWLIGTEGKKAAIAILGCFIFIPLLILVAYHGLDLYNEENPNIWIASPLVALGFIWMFMGYFTASYSKKAANAGQLPRAKATNRKRQLIGALCFIIGIIVWLWGNFKGFKQAESWWLVFSLFALAQGLNMAWRYR